MADITGTLSTLLIICCCFLLPQSKAETGSQRCWKCHHVSLSTDNSAIVTTFLSLITGAVGNPDCALQNLVSDKYGVDVVECPSSSDSGMVYKCSTVRGRVTTTIRAVAVSVHLDTVSRDCLQVPVDDPQYSGCRNTDTISGPVRHLVMTAIDQIKAINIDADITFHGQTCFDATLSSIPSRSTSVQCVTCRYSKLSSGTAVVGTLLSFLSTTSSDHCLLETPDDDYQVGSRICPEPPAGEQPVCGVIKGESTAVAANIKYETTQRGCLTQPVGAVQSGCTSELPPGGVVSSLINRGVESFGFEILFKGKVCYSDTGFGVINEQGFLVAASGHPGRHLSLMALAMGWLSTVVLKTSF